MIGPYRDPPSCAHGVAFDEIAWRRWQIENGCCVPAQIVREKWPRLFGACPLGCGFEGIAYASVLHYVAGDW